MSAWFEGSVEIACPLAEVAASVADAGQHFLEVVNRFPGLSDVVLVEQGEGWVTIRTNEGLMKRTGVSVSVLDDRITLAFDEEYQAGSMVTTTARYVEEFVPSAGGVTYRLAIESLEAPGVLGFFLRTFGKKSTGSAFLNSHKDYLEGRGGGGD